MTLRAAGPFASFFLGGFECSTHCRPDGHRLDLLEATGHDRYAERDYTRLREYGIHAVRDGLRWHRVETAPGRYDWSSLEPQLRAARAQDMQVVWDLCHYGFPDGLDIWSAPFVERFARFAAAAARVIGAASNRSPVYCPVNEMSFWAWAGGEVGRFNPACLGRGAELKRQLVRAALAAMDAIRTVDPRALFIMAEPLIHIDPGLGDEDHARAAEAYRLAQFEVLDLLLGRIEPQLGGFEGAVDLVGLNYYPDNQWYAGGPTIPVGHHAYRPLHDLLREVHDRYRLPMVIAETGAEGCGRAAWLNYVGREARLALKAGLPLQGLCLYPIADYPGWENGRVCRVGLLSEPDPAGRRAVCEALAEELDHQQRLFEPLLNERSPDRTRPFLQAAE